MNETIAKLRTIRQRVQSLMEQHITPPQDVFDNLRDQFFREADKLKIEFPTLADFRPEAYGKWLTEKAYYRGATKSLISDIDYFLNFLNNIESVQLPNLKITNEGLFFSGQYFEALSKLVDIIKTAKTEIIFIDGYVDEKILNIFSVTEGNIGVKILTKPKSVSTAFKTLVVEFNKQYKNQLEIKTSEAFHDRFLILDQKEFYHIGASMKDAGNRGFMFSRIEEPFLQSNLISEFVKEWK